jgi:hypothetical protein
VSPPAPQSPRPLSPLPPAVEEHLDNQENRPPIDLRNPCPRQHIGHPHQFIAVSTLRQFEWRPASEVSHSHSTQFPTARRLAENPPLFPSVTPFRSRYPNILHIRPCVTQLVEGFGIPPVDVCAHAVRFPPTREVPLGFIKYSFALSIVETFRPHSQLIKAAFSGALTILEVVDFLDGRTITTYGYLAFGLRDTYLEERGYFCDDLLRDAPGLFAYTLCPRVPADPFDHFKVEFNSDVPLGAT